MKLLKRTCIIFSLLIFGCNPKDTNYSIAAYNKATNKINKQTLERVTIGCTKLDKYEIESVENVIAIFIEKNIDKISSIIRFPLDRQYPIPAIHNKDELKQRFSEVFDQILIDKIANSKIEQWSEMGWRGIMLDNGILWMANSDGIITSVNYQSDFEKGLRQELIAKEKENIHISLRTFESPIYKIKTKNYLIRIDELKNHTYRYASWKVSDHETSKPDIVLSNGILEFEGSGGDHVITFVNGNYQYRIYRNMLKAEDSPDIELEIEENGEIILSEDGKLIIE